MGNKENFDELAPDEKKTFINYLKVYTGYEDDIKDTKRAQKEQIDICAKEIEGLSKKKVKKWFTYFKKNTKPEELRNDAEEISEIREAMDNG